MGGLSHKTSRLTTALWCDLIRVMVKDVLETLRLFVNRAGGQKAASVKLDCSPQFVSAMLSGKKPVPESVLGKLGFVRRTIISAK